MKSAKNSSFSRKTRLAARQRKGLDYFRAAVKKAFGRRLLEFSLYGSRARGTARPDSDTDILIAVQHLTQSDKDTIHDLENEVLAKFGLFISSRIMSQERYQSEKDMPSLFMQFVQNEGIAL